ncbi:unnamed protein product, partial [Mesorhabditis spiculigera]
MRMAGPQLLLRLCWCCLLITSTLAQKKEKPTRSVVITAEEEKFRDVAGYAAISDIHREMDDDQSGSIDRAESTGFMTEDMNMRGSDARRRETRFHGEDDAITIDDLWEAWFESEERAWTTQQVVDWMVNVVNLPQYADTLLHLKIDGRHLPRLAVHNSSFMTNTLNIKSSVHRQKLRLNALDVVLFGVRDTSNRYKDLALAFMLILFTTLLVVFLRQKRKATEKLQLLNEQLLQLKTMETEFEDAQKKLDDVRIKRSSQADGVSHAEMESLKEQLEEAHKRLGNMEVSGSATPLALQPLLRKTWEIEQTISESEKQTCIEEMKIAMEEINNVAKRQGSLFNSLKLATGANTGTDKVDSQIYFIKQRMERVQQSTREMQDRWLQIESLCGFPVLYTNEKPTRPKYEAPVRGSLASSASAQFYRSEGSTGSSKSLTSPASVTAANKSIPQHPSVSNLTGNANSTARGVPTFYAKSKDDYPEMYASNSTLPDSASLAGTTTTGGTLRKEKEKKKKLFGLFKKSSSKSNSNGSFPEST